MATGTRKDPISMLKEDHKKVRGLLKSLEKTTDRAGETREQLLARIAQEIKIHTTLEEEIFYPAYKAAVSKREDAKLYHEALEEHHVADIVLTEINQCDPKSEDFAAKAKVLKDLIEHHAEEEETQMFPRARRAMATAQLGELGKQMAERKRELQGKEGWLADAGKLLAAVAGSVPGASRMRAAAARGASPKKSAGKTAPKRSRAKTAKSSSRAKPASSRAKSTAGRKK